MNTAVKKGILLYYNSYAILVCSFEASSAAQTEKWKDGLDLKNLL